MYLFYLFSTFFLLFKEFQFERVLLIIVKKKSDFLANFVQLRTKLKIIRIDSFFQAAILDFFSPPENSFNLFGFVLYLDFTSNLNRSGKQILTHNVTLNSKDIPTTKCTTRDQMMFFPRLACGIHQDLKYFEKI